MNDTVQADRRQWTPLEYLDEISPPSRATPEAWIEKVEDGKAVFAPVEDDGYRIKCAVGETVDFSWDIAEGEALLRIWTDRHEVAGEMPPSFTRVCTIYAHGGYVGGTVDEIVEQAREDIVANEDGSPDEFPVLFFTDATEAVKLRLVDTTGRLTFVPAEAVS